MTRRVYADRSALDCVLSGVSAVTAATVDIGVQRTASPVFTRFAVIGRARHSCARRRSLFQKWICQPFPADRCRRPVAGEHSHIVSQRKYFFPDPVDQQIHIAAGQITATNTAGEKNVATNEQSILPRKETKATGAVARHFQNLEIHTEKCSVWRLFDQEIRFDWFDFQREPEVSEEIAIGNHRRGERVTSDLAMKLLFNPGNVLDVIDVPMC